MFLLFSFLLIVVKITIHNIKFIILTICSVQFNHIKYIHTVMQPLPLFSKSFHQSKLKLCTHYTINPSVPSSPAPADYCSTFCLYKFDYLISVESYSVSLLVYFPQHNVFKIHPCCNMCQNLIIFKGWIIFYCMDIPLSVYLFIHQWTFMFFSPCGDRECYGHGIEISV